MLVSVKNIIPFSHDTVQRRGLSESWFCPLIYSSFSPQTLLYIIPVMVCIILKVKEVRDLTYNLYCSGNILYKPSLNYFKLKLNFCQVIPVMFSMTYESSSLNKNQLQKYVKRKGRRRFYQLIWQLPHDDRNIYFSLNFLGVFIISCSWNIIFCFYINHTGEWVKWREY